MDTPLLQLIHCPGADVAVRGERQQSPWGSSCPRNLGHPLGETHLSLLTVEEAEDGGAAGRVPERRSDASASRPYFCGEMRCAFTLVVRCSASGDEAVVVLMWSRDKRRSWAPLLPDFNSAQPQCLLTLSGELRKSEQLCDL